MENLRMNLDVSSLRSRVAHIGDYFGVWSIYEQRFQALFNSLGTIDINAHIKAQQNSQPEALSSPGFMRSPGGVAVVELVGPLMKHVSSFSGGTSTIAARRAIRNAANDETISSILLSIDSPGGTVAGTQDLADDVFAAAKIKTVHASIQDFGASAAYWVASQATKIFTTQSTLAGGMGTFLKIFDMSKMAENEGVEVLIIKAGEFKGMGTPGTKITDEQIEQFQIVVDDLNDHFMKGVANGRSMLSLAEVKKLADGRIHIAAKAKRLNLIDGIEPFDATLARLSKSSNRRTKPMNEANAETEQATTDAVPQQVAGQSPPPLATRTAQVISTAASIDEIKAACPGSEKDNDFLVSQLAAKATTGQAQAAWMTLQNQRVEASEKENTELKAANPAPTKPGVQALADNASGGQQIDGDATAQWDAKVAEALASPRINTKAQAVIAVNKAHPELREAMVAQANAGRTQN